MARLAVLIVCALAMALPATAAKKKAPLDPPMTVVIVRSNVPGCEPDCPQWIAAEGRITGATPALFQKVLKRAGTSALPIVVASPGGDVHAAIAIGRMIRAKKLDVAVGFTYFATCGPKTKDCKLPKAQRGVYRGLVFGQNAYCSSACSLILAAGTMRIHSTGSFVGVHQISTEITQERLVYRERFRVVGGKKRVVSRTVVGRKKVKSFTTTKLRPGLQRKLEKYLTAMGVELSLLDYYQKAPPESIYWMGPADTRTTKLATAAFDIASYAQIAQCRGVTMARHCVTLPAPKDEVAADAKPKAAAQ